MGNNMKRFLSIVLALVMVVGMLPVYALAADVEAAWGVAVEGVEVITVPQGDAGNITQRQLYNLLDEKWETVVSSTRTYGGFKYGTSSMTRITDWSSDSTSAGLEANTIYTVQTATKESTFNYPFADAGTFMVVESIPKDTITLKTDGTYALNEWIVTADNVADFRAAIIDAVVESVNGGAVANDAVTVMFHHKLDASWNNILGTDEYLELNEGNVDKYNASKDNATFQISYGNSDVQTVAITWVDPRLVPVITAENTEITYTNTAITKNAVLTTVFEKISVTAEDGTPIEVSLDEIEIVETRSGLSSIWAYKLNEGTGEYSISQTGSIGENDGGKYKMTVKFKGNDDYTEATADVYFTVEVIERGASILAANKDDEGADVVTQIDYYGAPIAKEAVLAEVFKNVSVTDAEGNPIAGITAGDMSINETWVVLGTIWANKWSNLTNDYSTPQATPIGGDILSYTPDALGKYKMTIKFDGNSDYLESNEIDVIFEVVDGRKESSIAATNGDEDLYKAGDNKVTEEEILEALNIVITDAETGKPIEGATASIYSITKQSVIPVPDLISKSINEEGTYSIAVQFNGNDTYMGSERATATLTVYDGRPTPTITLKADSVETKDISQVIDLNLADMEFGVYNGNDLITDSVDAVTVTVTPSEIKNPGEYTVKVTYAENNYYKGAEATATLTVVDARTETAVNLTEGVKIPYDPEEGAITEEDVFNEVFESVTNVEDYAYNAENVTITDGNGNVVTEITEVEAYTITVVYPESNTIKGSEATVPFTVTDGRNVISITLNNGMDFNWYVGLTEEYLTEKLLVSVVDTATNEAVTGYTVTFDVAPEAMEIGGTYTITVSFAGNDVQAPATRNATFTVSDLRLIPSINLKEGQSVVYTGNAVTADDAYALVFEAVTGENGEDIDVVYGGDNPNLTIAVPNNAVNVGTYTATVSFIGNNEYKEAIATVDFTIEKADAGLSVGNLVEKFENVPAEGFDVEKNLITTNGDVEYISFVVGLGVGEHITQDAAGIVYVDLPDMLDGLLGDSGLGAMAKPIIEGLLNRYLGQEMNISDFYDAMKNILDTLATWVPGLDTESIQPIINVLEQIQNIPGIGNLRIKLTLNNGNVITDSGVFIVGAVSLDDNYNTDFGVNYLVLTPDGVRTYLDFNYNDENGIITWEALKSVDLNASAYDDEALTVLNEAATERVQNLFLGVDANGEFVITADGSELGNGAYTQLAYILELGNQFYYAVPIIRAFAITPNVIDVELVDAEGAALNAYNYTFDNTAKELYVEVNGEIAEDYTINYVGLQTNGKTYNSTEAPVHAGVYTATVTYTAYNEAGEFTGAGADLAVITIKPTESTIDVENSVHVFDNEKVNTKDLINATSVGTDLTPDTTIITASIATDGTFSEVGFEAIKGNVNVDFPAWLDEILSTRFESAYANGVNAQDFINKLNQYTDALLEKGVSNELINSLNNLLNNIPSSATLTFNDQSEVNPNAVGAYLIIGIVTDSDHIPTMDAGILYITLNTNKAELKFADGDANNIFFLDTISRVNLNADAYIDGEYSAEATAEVKNVFTGVDLLGNKVKTDDYTTLLPGVYTQFSYIKDGIDSTMYFAAPISRVIVVSGNMYTVEIIDENGDKNHDRKFVYDGTAKEIGEIVVRNVASGAVVDYSDELTVTYIGIDSRANGYKSSEAPTNAGAYSVSITYVERNENGAVIGMGSAVGAMVIEKGQSNFELLDTEVVGDGESKFVDVINDYEVPYVSVIQTENGWNISFPEELDALVDLLPERVDATEFKSDLELAISALNVAGAIFNRMDLDTEFVEKLADVVGGLNDAIPGVVTINGENPVEIGSYDVYAVTCDPNFKCVVSSATLTITPDYVAQNVQTGVKYTTVERALYEAKAGHTVILIADEVYEEYVLVTPGTTLDLNGYELEADYVVGFGSSHVIDSTRAGLLIVAQENIVLDEGNKMVPLWNDRGYVFTNYQIIDNRDEMGVTVDTDKNVATFKFIAAFQDSALLADNGGTDNDVSVVVRLEWEIENTGIAYQDFVYNNEQVAEVVAADGDRAFILTVNDYQSLKNLTFTAMILTESGMEAAGTEFAVN